MVALPQVADYLRDSEGRTIYIGAPMNCKTKYFGCVGALKRRAATRVLASRVVRLANSWQPEINLLN